MVLQGMGIHGEPQPAVDNDGLGAVSVDMPYRQQGIVRQNGADTHQDAVVDRPQLWVNTMASLQLRASGLPGRQAIEPSMLWA